MRERTSNLVAVCAWCGRTRIDSGEWRQLEKAARAGPEPLYTHGICNDCERKVWDDLRVHRTA